MASFGCSSVNNVQTSATTEFTSDSDSTLVLSILIANTTANNSTITCTHIDAANAVLANVANPITVPANANVDLIGNKLVIPSGTKLQLSSSIADSVDASISFVVV